MPSMTEVSCAWCSAKFQARTADVRRGWGKYCTKKCKAMEQEKRTGQNAAYLARTGGEKRSVHDIREDEHQAAMDSMSDSDYGASDGD